MMRLDSDGPERMLDAVKTLFLISAALAAVAGAVSAEQCTPDAARMFVIAGSLPLGVKVNVRVDGHKYPRVKQGHYELVCLSPGTHQIQLMGITHKSTLNFESRQEYYFRADMVPFSNGSITPLTTEEGHLQVQYLRAQRGP